MIDRPPVHPEPTHQGEAEEAMSSLKVFLAGAAYGLFARLAMMLPPFGDGRPSGDGALGAMLFAFVVLVPMVIGYLTLTLSGPSRRSWWFAIWGPWSPTLLFVAGTGVIALEGLICILMALPLFLLMASIGGLVTKLVLGLKPPQPGVMAAVALLPFAAALPERQLPLPQGHRLAHESILIASPPETIWKLINHATDIRPEEMQTGLAYRIGVPVPKEAITIETPTGRVRKLKWDHGIAFDEPITEWQENRTIFWDYQFKPGTFPPETLDEHVVIGGRYFDLINTRYTLTPETGGTRLAIDVTYRVSTHFNWYANFWGDWLVDDTAKVILHFYQRRSEA